jgi:hypothetical protein
LAIVEAGVEDPDDPVDVLLQATTTTAATIRHNRAKIAFQTRAKRLAGRGAVMSSSMKISGFAGDVPIQDSTNI